jgi:hypothetical protein
LIRRPLPRGKLRSRSFCITGRTSSSQGSVARILPVDFQNALCPRLAREFPSTAATSALDSATEARAQKAFQTLMQGRTTLIIADRLATIRNADLILVVQQGRIIERGTFDAHARGDGLFAQLVSAQSGSLRKES